MITQSLYHMLIRTTALLVAVVLVFESGLFTPLSKQLSDQTRWYLASAIGMTATVETTPLNIQTAALTERSQALDEREAALASREIAVNVAGQSGGTGSSAVSTYILSLLLFFLLTLIILNYVMDFIRARDARVSPSS